MSNYRREEEELIMKCINSKEPILFTDTEKMTLKVILEDIKNAQFKDSGYDW